MDHEMVFNNQEVRFLGMLNDRESQQQLMQRLIDNCRKLEEKIDRTQKMVLNHLALKGKS